MAVNYYGGIQTIHVYISPTPITTTSGFGVVVNATGDMLIAKILLMESGREYWSDWQSMDVEYSYWTSKNALWANHDLYTVAGKLYVSTCPDPTLATLPEVLFDGEIDSSTSNPSAVPTMSHLAVGDTARITIDGIVSEHVVRTTSADRLWVIGNENVLSSALEDNGGDWVLTPYRYGVEDGNSTGFNDGHMAINFYHRTDGTHQVKIERIAIAKE
jgi:hypothetical protein